jgi:peptide/nickel transport system permease protein
MGKYVLKRILMMIPTLLAVVFIIFVLINITPGDPGRIMLGQDAAQEDVDAVNAMMHMDKPLVMRYLYYIWDALHLDFGVSFLTRQPVFSELFSKVPVTFTLALGTALVSVLIGVPLGVIAAVKEHTLLDSSLTISSLLIAAIPGFWLSIMMILLFSVKLRLLPSSGIGSPLHYVMPILGSSIGNAAYYLRMTRSAMQDALRQEYIKTARAKGASNARTIVVHALRNALMIVVTQMTLSFVALMGGSMLTETIFGLPGVGATILRAINMKDVPMIMASTIFVTLTLMVGLLLVDVLNAFLDPRVRARYK